MNKTKIFIIVFSIILLLIGGIYFIINSGKNPTTVQKETVQELKPVSTITHGHGLSVDVQNPENVYIATHHGLLLLKNDKELFQIGESEDDFMGFSAHPTESEVFFSSGHPKAGGNIGFQKSMDGGSTWKKLSNGVNGPVDFHALAVSPINPSIIFGWYQGALQKSTDGGKNWEIVSNTEAPIVNLVADTKDVNILYAATPQGLLKSMNQGKDWDLLINGFVSTVAIHPKDSNQLISYSEDQKLAISNDSGKSWKVISADFEEGTPLFISYTKQDPKVIYLLTEKNIIFKTTDGSTTWGKVF